MPNVYLENDLYKRIVRLGADESKFVKEAVEHALHRKEPKTEETEDLTNLEEE